MVRVCNMFHVKSASEQALKYVEFSRLQNHGDDCRGRDLREHLRTSNVRVRRTSHFIDRDPSGDHSRKFVP